MKTLGLIVFVLSFTFTTPIIARVNYDYTAQYDKSCGQWVNFRNEGGWEHAAVIAITDRHQAFTIFWAVLALIASFSGWTNTAERTL